MSTNPTFRLSVEAFPQRWDGTNILLRFLILPQGNPLSPLLTGVLPVPSSPAFADAKPKFVVQLIPSLANLPAPSAATAQVSLLTVPPTGARALFEQLATQFNIVATSGQAPRRVGYSTSKYLPESYRNAFNFDRPSTPFAVTDNSYHCLLENLPAKLRPQPPPPSTISWGRVIAFSLRQPLVATALGLLYETSFVLPDPSAFASGGWIYITLDPSSDFSLQIAVNPTLFQPYAARLPALTAPRPLFAAVLFPVLSTPPTGSYDSVFVEAEEYDDGFAKIVHGAQPISADLLDTSGGGLPPAGDYGLSLGWDDEQVTTWFNRQIDATQVDAPFGAAGYRIDVRAHGNTAWNSLCHVIGTLALGATKLGVFDGELGVETVPAGLDPTEPSALWLPSYFAQWQGGSVVLADPIALELHGTTNPRAGQPYTAAPDATAVALLYGQSYDVRVRLMDISRGGPGVSDTAINPGPAPIATIPFRRFVPFKSVTITNLDQTATPAVPQTTYQIARPLLNYPAVVFAGAPNAVAALLADLPKAQAAGREAALPDPDAVSLAIDVQVRQLANDAGILVEGDDHAPYSLLYSTTRRFPTDASQLLRLDVSFEDVKDITAFPTAQPGSGALVLPRARDLRLVFRAAAKPDPQLRYWGSSNAMIGQTIEVLTAADGVDERALFTPDIAANRIRGIMLQPDPVPTSNLAAMLALLGQSGTATSDLATRLAQALSLKVSALTYSAQPGQPGQILLPVQRVVFGCSSALRNTLSPEHGAITFAAKSELTQHWLIVISLGLARDWSWGSLAPTSFEIRNTANQVVGRIDMTSSVSASVLQGPVNRSGSRLIFFDAVDPKPAVGAFPAELNLSYTVTPVFAVAPAQQDPPLQLSLLLPIAARPMQTPQLASAGVALTPYAPAPDYSSTTPRQRALWIEFAQPIADPDDMYFARVLSYAPDQMLTGLTFVNPDAIVPPPEPPLPIDPELIRTIAPGQSDDQAGLTAMQPLIPSSLTPNCLHFMLPLPTGLAMDAPELFGMFVYEFRVGHLKNWSTAQGRFGPALRVAGVQHPAPPLLASVKSLPATVSVSAPYATPTFNGQNLLPVPPRTQLWGLLYAQVTQADGASQRNVLLDRQLLTNKELEGLFDVRGIAGALWQRPNIVKILTALALSTKSPLSIVVVETFHDLGNLGDPLGGDLGHVRILRASPLTAVPAVC
jgi:hypothetical protein